MVRRQPTMLLPERGCLKTRTEMMIMHTCFTFPVMLMTSGDVDFVASKFDTFNANAVKPWKASNRYTYTG